MKKSNLTILMTLCMLFLGVFGSASAAEAEQPAKALVAYFAYSENVGDVSNLEADAVSSASLNASTTNQDGNLQIMAQEIASATQADVFHILVNEPYALDYTTMLPRAIQEMESEAWPALQSKIENLADYDVIYLGTPVWNATFPPALHTFFAENDLTGKKIVLFNINLGSGLGSLERDLQELVPGAELVDAYTVRAGEDNATVQKAFSEWLASVNSGL